MGAPRHHGERDRAVDDREETRRELLHDAEAIRRHVSLIPLGRLGEPEDVVGAAVFLAGPLGGFVTGQTPVIDGGYSIA
ncbi:MAG: SDR family oxidoreductase [Chloroflexota bacterium]|nr:SDR family oxidoreductase [Chloroflexota bacterium]